MKTVLCALVRLESKEGQSTDSNTERLQWQGCVCMATDGCISSLLHMDEFLLFIFVSRIYFGKEEAAFGKIYGGNLKLRHAES